MDKVKYIPGDLVKYRGIVFKIDKIALHSPYVNLIKRNKQQEYRFFTVETELLKIQSIPLTSEILEKNGWRKNEHEIYHKICDEKKIIFIMKVRDGSWNVNVGDVTLIYCKYLHELQHLLFGLGLNSELKV